jgi:hypothetical protein
MSFTKLVAFVTLALASGVFAAPVSERQIDIPIILGEDLDGNSISILKVTQLIRVNVSSAYSNFLSILGASD